VTSGGKKEKKQTALFMNLVTSSGAQKLTKSAERKGVESRRDKERELGKLIKDQKKVIEVLGGGTVDRTRDL